jgi:L-aspartate oxidase
VQFHPTCLYHPEARSFLISEAVRGEGALLRTVDGDRFMPRYDARAELAPRDIVARAIDSEMKKRGDKHVLLDLAPIGRERTLERFPNIAAACGRFGFDVTAAPIPVVPAAHYMCGGVVVDLMARTDLPGLYAAGEVALTGVHGANRLASNSLLEALVYAHHAAADAARFGGAGGPARSVPTWEAGAARAPRESVVMDHNWDLVRRLMWDYVGIVRSDERLETARRRIALIREEIEACYWEYVLSPDLIELRNIGLVADLVIRSAAGRLESRGLHCNRDHPERDDARWGRDTILSRGGEAGAA